MDLSESSYPCKITVFTPAYNRAHTLPRLYGSLCDQTFKNFEWLVVDDGSTDETLDLLRKWQEEKYLNITVHHQKNSGMHIAVNRGLELAKTRYFIKVDSDDRLKPEALMRYLEEWNNLREEGKANDFSAVHSLCVDDDGKIIGNKFPVSPWDADYLALKYVHKIGGDKKGMVRTTVWREYPYAETPYLSSNPWLRMARKYKTRFINEPLYVYSRESNWDSISLGNEIKKPMTYVYRISERLNNDLDYFFYNPRLFLYLTKMYIYYSKQEGLSFRTRFGRLKRTKAKLLYLLVPLLYKVQQIIFPRRPEGENDL